MERFYEKSTGEFYSLIFFIVLSTATITLDYKYNQITYIRLIINDLIVYPIDQLSYLPKTIITKFIDDSDNIENLKDTITKLKNENIELKIKLQQFQSLQDENRRLRNISKKSIVTSNKKTIAKVISNSASPNKRVITIDKGQKHGIFIGQNVIGINGLVGQIVETNFLSSKVILISDLNHKIPAEVNRTGQKILISGSKESNQLIVNYSDSDIDIVVDDHVSTSGIAKRFKPKIPIGRVTSVQKDPEKKFSVIKLEPFENVGNMSELILIWDYTPEVKKEEEQKNDGEKIE